MARTPTPAHKRFHHRSAIAALAMVLLLVATVGSANAFYSLHSESKEYWYKDLSGNWQSVIKSGYRYRHDLEDPIILCGDESGCDTYETFNFGDTVYSPTYTEFRIFIPPGTQDVFFKMYVFNDTQMAVLMRLGTPPQGDLNGTPYSQIPFRADGATLQELRSGDVANKLAGGGVIAIINERNLEENHGAFLSETGGQWLYVRLYNWTGSVKNIKWNTTVKLSVYNPWFASNNWDTFGEQGGGSGSSSGGGSSSSSSSSGGSSSSSSSSLR